MNSLDDILIKLSKKNKSDNIIKVDENIKIKKVAFDIYTVDKGRSMSEHYEGLWKLEDINGSPYLVRASDPQYASNASGDWTATSSYENNNVILAYKNVPIANFASSDFGYSENDIPMFKQALLDRVLSDDDFKVDIFSIQSLNKKEALANTFPEFKKYIKG